MAKFFHKAYLPIYTINTEISAGETPLIREACPMVLGCIFLNFSRASEERAGMASKSNCADIVMFSSLAILSASFYSFSR